MDRGFAYSVLATVALTIIVCFMAVAIVFGGRIYYFTEDTTKEPLNGLARRLSVDAPITFEDGSRFDGVFVVGRGLQHRVTLPSGWVGDLEIVKFPDEAGLEPMELSSLIRDQACHSFNDAGLIDAEDVIYESIFFDEFGETIKTLRIEASSCAAGT